MYRQRAPVLSPATAKQLVEAFAHTLPSSPSDSPDSPESSYSSSFSPRMNEQPFEFSTPAHEQYSQHEEDEYESLMANGSGWDAAPAWGRWPETTGAMPSWSSTIQRSPSGGAGSIISLSPRGSLSGVATPVTSAAAPRKSSTTFGKSWHDERRDSDPSLLGFDLAARASSANQRRRRSSGGRSIASSARRSSVVSTASIDPSEDARLRSFASMEALGRRFSEVVEVTVTAGSDDEEVEPLTGSALDRNTSRWSPWTASSYDESVLRTGSAFPTPELPAQQLPVVMARYAPDIVDPVNAFGTPSSDFSAPPSPYALHRPPMSRSHSSVTITAHTPPPAIEPAEVVRARMRPSTLRSVTEYEFPARSAGVPPGAAPPRPAFTRSVSGPVAPIAVQSAPKDAVSLSADRRAQGSFPLSRSIPIGISPLRASLRRQSVVSDGSSRRGSIAVSEGSRRPSHQDGSLAGRRLSREKDASPSARRISEDLRRASLTSNSRKGSVSGASSMLTDRRRSSVVSRKSSIVSIGEYAYLGPEIVIDAPPTPATQSRPSLPATSAGPSRLRAAAPPAIALPAYSFPALSPPLTTPRFNPLDSFFGRDPSPAMSPSATLEPTSPFASSASDSDTQKTPILPQPLGLKCPRSVMDRPRPVSSAEYRDYSIPLAAARAVSGGSPKSPRSPPGQGGSSSRGVLSPHLQVDLKTSPAASFTSQITSTDDEMASSSAMTPSSSSSSSATTTRPVVPRKAVPHMSLSELRAAYTADLQLREQREIAASRAAGAGAGFDHSSAQSEQWMSPADQAILRGAAGHRRAISVEQPTTTTRPSPRRQTTLPTALNRSVSDKRYGAVSSQMRSPPAVAAAGAGIPPLKEKTIVKRASVTFVEPVRPNMGRASSFSRFFHSSKPKNAAPAHTAVQHSQYASIPRPISLDASSDQSFGEVRAALQRL